MAITTLAQTLGITPAKIVVTEIEQDDDTGHHVREIRFLDAEDVAFLTVRVSNADASKIKLSAPEQEF
jgi:hypothetical protein